MTTKILVEIVATDKGLKVIQRNMDDLSQSVDKVSKRTRGAANSAEDLYNKQEKGVIGTANSTKSFSKLAQTIGSGGSGLVGAYATLAANTFAVSAAFNALKSAQQAQMVLQGLEAQGARTGSSLTVAADKLREIVGFGLSSQETMSATALFTSSGFNTEELERLGEVAKNSSLALGRNLPDSMDRLIKGTTKLEPELLDELGIMTKLGDATSAYALKVGKTANALTPLERKQAFLNAVLAEGELKFGGISDAIDTNPYDKLSATFVDLTTNSLNFVNSTLGLNTFINFLSENINALGGVVLLFAATIQKELLGSLNDLSTKSSLAAAATKELATKAKENIKTEIDLAKATRETAIAQARNITINERSSKGLKDRAAALKEGALSEKEFEKAINSNALSIKTHTAYMETDAAAGRDPKVRQALIDDLKRQGSQLEKLRDMEVEYAKTSAQAQGASLSSLRKEYALSRTAKAQEAAATAIQTASNLELGASLNSLAVATRNYSIAVKVETRDKLASSTATGTLLVAQTALARGMGAARVAAFAASTGVKALGGAILRIIPYVGIAMLALDGLIYGWEWIASKVWPAGTKAQKELTKASEEFTKILETQTESLAYYAKIQESTASASSRATAATLNQANSLIELAEGFNKVVEAQKAKRLADEKDATASTSKPGEPYRQRTLEEVRTEGRAQRFGIDADSLAFELGSKVMESSAKRILSAFRAPEEGATEFIGTLKTLEARLGKEGLAKAVEASVGSLQKFKELSPEEQYSELSKISTEVANNQSKIKEAVEGLNAAFTAGETAASKFFKDAIGTTPFDDIVSSFEQINANVRTLAREGKSATEQLQLISGVGSELQKFLSTDASTLLDTLRSADAVYQSLVGRQNDLVGADKIKFDQAAATLKENEKNLPILRAALESAESENKLRQASVALSKAQANLLQAQLSKYSEFLNAGAEGARAQIRAQREINSLNAAAQVAQKAVLDGMIAQEDLKLKAMQNELTELELKQKSLNLDQQKTLEYAKQYEILFNSSRIGPFKDAYIVNTAERDPGQAVNDAQEALKASSKAADELKIRITSVENSLRAARLQSQALALSIAAATTASLSPAQENAAAASADAKALAAQNAQARETASITRKEAALDNQLIATKNGLLDSTAYKLSIINDEYLNGKAALQEIEDQVLINGKEILRAQSMLVGAPEKMQKGIREQIAALEVTNRELNKQKLSQSIALEVQKNINTVQLLGLNTIEERANAQKELLDIAQKELDVYQELESIRYANDNQKRDTMAIITGTTLNNEVRDAENTLRIAKETQDLRIQVINQEYDLLEAQRKLRQEDYEQRAVLALDAGDADKFDMLKGLAEKTKASANTIADARSSAVGAVTASTEQKELELSKARITQHTNVLLENFKKLGPDGEAAAAIFSGMTTINFAVTDAFKDIGAEGATAADKISAIAGAASAAIGAVAAMLAANSNAKIAAIDKEIAAEQKRDGKSADSVAKLEQLEKKKDSMARKAFNTNKKLMMAQAVMSTAAGITMALGQGGILGIPMAVLIGAMGAAQLAIIAGTSYEGSASAKSASMPTALSVGKRSDTVDLARGPNANAGGEVGFLRGSSGSGSNAGNYNTVGSAYGGELMRGYGNRGFVVGEKGPEIITPETPISVTPTNEMQSQQPLNATFNIQALDSSGVQDLLVAQKGNIIAMLRSAANASGQSFMEEVNVNVYTRPNINRL